MKKIFFLSAFIIATLSINAQIVTERPTQSESAVILPKNSFQIESGMIVQQSGENLNDPLNISAPLTLFRYGVSKHFELRFLSPYNTSVNFNNQNFANITSGFGDMEVGTKIQLVNNEKLKTQIAFVTHLVIPTGAEGFTTNEYSSINKIAVSHSLNDYTGIGWNIGYIYYGTGASSLIYSAGLGININEKFGIFVEPYGEISEFSTLSASINGGIFYQLKENLQADFSFGTGINHSMNFYAIGFGWNIARDSE